MPADGRVTSEERVDGWDRWRHYQAAHEVGCYRRRGLGRMAPRDEGSGEIVTEVWREETAASLSHTERAGSCEATAAQAGESGKPWVLQGMDGWW